MCNAGMHESCMDFDCLCAMNNHAPIKEHNNDDEKRILDVDSDFGDRSPSRGKSNGKRDSALKDQQSTGRKRAAKLYPLPPDPTPCEWQNKKHCGGGPKPILGCIEGIQQARHHGPDKSVTNNEEGNVHRICHGCHYRWHAANDSTYDWNAAILTTHSPIPHTDSDRKEAIMISLKMMAKKNLKIKD